MMRGDRVSESSDPIADALERFHFARQEAFERALKCPHEVALTEAEKFAIAYHAGAPYKIERNGDKMNVSLVAGVKREGRKWVVSFKDRDGNFTLVELEALT